VSWNEVLPAGSIRFKLTPRQTVYFRYATGYRPGGFNNPNSSVLDIYKPERSFSYEVGWKGYLFGFDMDADVYSQTTRDVQVTTFGGGGALIIIQNPGNAYVYGIETNIGKKYDVGPGKLSVALGLSSNYGRYYDTRPFVASIGQPATSLDGNRVPRTRNIQGALNTTYSMPIFGGGMRTIFGASWQFASGGHETPQNTRTYNGYGKLDLRASLASSDGWALTAFGKNVFDRRYEQQSINTLQFWSQPATFGITLSLMQ
jgi:outer membrane receptor protein involved in Fe transport